MPANCEQAQTVSLQMSAPVCEDGRKATELTGDMALYFVHNDDHIQPNRLALKFHKAACLIWRMAGGAEEDEKYCSLDDGDDGACVTHEKIHERLRDIQRWQESSATLIDNNKF